ncbi:MAG: FAD-dependent oxidoreductase [Proteobacteria bacterium]|nr:FAD-dependent oxidoreductase [Pseudomonadota bacterium]
MFDVIIIGGGFGGLSSAALLSRKGKKVLLIESRKRLGGRAHYIEKDGFVWQYGQHSHRLGPDGHANQVMTRLGEPMTFYETDQKKAKLFYKGRLYDRPNGPAGFLTTQALSFKAKLVFLRLYVKILQEDATLWYDKTLIDFYKSFFKPNREVEGFLNFLGFTIMLPDASIVSAGEVIDFIKRVNKSKIPVADVAGGSKHIIDRLEAVIIKNGGIIKASEKVMKLSVNGRKIDSVETDKGLYQSEMVVYAAPVKYLTEIIDASFFDSRFLNHIKNLKNSGGVIIDFISHEPLSDLEGGILGVDEPLWVKFQTLFDKTVAPRGYHVCTWGLLTAWGQTNNPDAFRATEKRLREIAAICMPGYRNKVIDERKVIIPVVNANMLIPSQSRPHRPSIKSVFLDNLYMAGDTVNGHGCSGDIAFSSALMLDDMIQ